MKRLFCILPLLLLLTACGSNKLFNEADPDHALMMLCIKDESGRRQYALNDNSAEHEILDKLRSVNAKQIEWSPDELEYPIYTLDTGSTDNGTFYAVWSGGTLLTTDGNAYEFDFNFEKLLSSYNWVKEETFDLFISPWQRLLCEHDSVWYPEYMPDAELFTVHKPVEGVSLEIGELAEKDGKPIIPAVIRNNSGEEYCFGKYYHLEVKLNGKWYYVPDMPDRPLFVQDIGLILMDDQSIDMSYSLWNWGELPSGTYRLCVYGMTAEFTID